MRTRSNRESDGTTGGYPDERTSQNAGRIDYSDTDILELADPGRVVRQPEAVTTGERIPVRATQVASVSKSTASVRRAEEPEDIWVVEREELEHFSHRRVLARHQQHLRECNLRQSLFANAIQRFEMHNQFFADSCDKAYTNGPAEVITTLQAVRRVGDELFPPRREFFLAVTRLRHFVLSLIERLSPISSLRNRNSVAFNALSHEYEDKESAIRVTIMNITAKVGGDPRKKLEMFMRAFKTRLEVLRLQQAQLEVLAKECLEELEHNVVEA
ncbi:hypothetical protein SLS60_000166 [Paraconiothyrium brasiliense]|uniref:Uncharacterized protein n=1 Tax=Paraconiothyrium brasiliense TaxID=300254 RepID=A0ABR3S622_9PLEO